jgi:hypothetical protein
MEEIYKRVKLPNGKYKFVSIGYEYNRDTLGEGIWLVIKKPGSTSTSAMLYQIGNIDKANIPLHGNLQAFSHELSSYLGKLQDNGTNPEQEDAYNLLGEWWNRPQIYNISMHDLSTLILRKLATLI